MMNVALNSERLYCRCPENWLHSCQQTCAAVFAVTIAAAPEAALMTSMGVYDSCA